MSVFVNRIYFFPASPAHSISVHPLQPGHVINLLRGDVMTPTNGILNQASVQTVKLQVQHRLSSQATSILYYEKTEIDSNEYLASNIKPWWNLRRGVNVPPLFPFLINDKLMTFLLIIY